MTISETENSLFQAAKAAYLAGCEIMQVYASADFQISKKDDDSPLTLADRKAHETIMSILITTDLPVLSEEGDDLDYEKRKNYDLFWLVDPLDGTKEFINKNDEFTVNIALVLHDNPIAGIIYVPVYKQMYFADTLRGVFRKNKVDAADFSESKDYESLCESSQKLPFQQEERPYRAVASRSHLSQQTKDFLSQLEQEHGTVEIVSKGSSLKMCMIAEGTADIYPRFGPTMEWDTAAGHAIAKRAGAQVHQLDGKPLRYNKENLLNPYFIVRR